MREENVPQRRQRYVGQHHLSRHTIAAVNDVCDQSRQNSSTLRRLSRLNVHAPAAADVSFCLQRLPTDAY
jgi:hypothetical protein